MDRILKVYSKTQHLFAEFIFSYDNHREASVHYIEYRRLYNDDEEDENKSVYRGMEWDQRLNYAEFKSIDEIKAHDKEVVKKEMGREMKDAPDTYSYVYEEQPVLQRYVYEDHRGCHGMINIMYSFIGNTKELRFLSAKEPRFDFEISSDSLETNLSCIKRILLFNEWGEQYEISPYDLKKLPTWY
jgi:hypothetical protein